jgi:hypothetical protein
MSCLRCSVILEAGRERPCALYIFSLWMCSFTKKSKAQRRLKVDMVEIINERSTGTQAHRPEQISNLVCRASAYLVSANAKGLLLLPNSSTKDGHACLQTEFVW